MDFPSGLAPTSNPSPEICESPLSFGSINIIIIVCSVLGLLWAAYNFLMVRRVDLEQQPEEEDEEQGSEDLPADKKRLLLELSYKVSDVSPS
jgi:hypothetical protein